MQLAGMLQVVILSNFAGMTVSTDIVRVLSRDRVAFLKVSSW